MKMLRTGSQRHAVWSQWCTSPNSACMHVYVVGVNALERPAYFPTALHFESVFIFRDLRCYLQLISSHFHLHLLARCFICGFWDHDARSLWSAVHPVSLPLCVIPLPGGEDRPHSKWCALPWNWARGKSSSGCQGRQKRAEEALPLESGEKYPCIVRNEHSFSVFCFLQSGTGYFPSESPYTHL